MWLCSRQAVVELEAGYRLACADSAVFFSNGTQGPVPELPDYSEPYQDASPHPGRCDSSLINIFNGIWRTHQLAVAHHYLGHRAFTTTLSTNSRLSASSMSFAPPPGPPPPPVPPGWKAQFDDRYKSWYVLFAPSSKSSIYTDFAPIGSSSTSKQAFPNGPSQKNPNTPHH